jgi:hypothetical protein
MQVFQIDGLTQDIDVFPDDSDLGHLRISSMVARPWGIGENLFFYVSDNDGLRRVVKFVSKTGQSSDLRVERDPEHGHILPVPTFSADGNWYTSGMDVCRVDDGIAILELQGLTSQVARDQLAANLYDLLVFSHDKETLYGIPNSPLDSTSWRIDRWPISLALKRKQVQLSAPPIDTLFANDEGSGGPVNLAISQDDQYLAAITYSGRHIYRWKLQDKTNMPTIVLLRSSDFNFGRCHLEYSPDSRWLVGAGTQIFIIRAEDSTSYAIINSGPVRSLAITLDSQTVLTVNGEHRLEQWHIPSGEKLREYSFDDLIGPAECVTVSPDGFTAYVAGTEGRFLRWDLE